MVTLFHDMMHWEIEVYVNDMIVKSRTIKEHLQVLRKLFLRLRKFQLKLNPTKCTFGARLGKLLGFVVSEKGIEIDPDKVKAIQELPPSRTQKEVRGVWDEECQKTFDKVKHHLSNAPVLMPPNPDRPLILYLAVFGNFMGCVLGQHDESGRKERAIYYLSKKFTECETRYLPIEKLCCALIWTTRRLRQYMLYLKGSAIADFLASRALEDYKPLNFDFPNEDLIYVATTEEDSQESHSWKLNFDSASNAAGNGIGAVLIALNGDHYPFTSKLDFDCTNNMAEYEACIMGIHAAIEREIKVLEVYGDSALVIYQLKGEWETRDPKLIKYRKLVLELIKDFDDITFFYLPRDENQMADALATLASMVRVNKQEDVQPIQMSIYEVLAHYYSIEEEEEKDNNHWYNDILRYMKNHDYPDQATENDKRTLRRLANDYVLDGEICIKEERIRMDVIGPISPKASNGHRFIFVVIDYFTKWVEATSYANVTKSAVSKFLKKKIICRYGMLERIISDNALNLNNSTIAEVCSQFKIKHHNSSPYRPKMNGAVEAANKNIKKIVGKMTETYKDWHEKLPFTLYAYRTSVRTSTGATPFSLVYGMEAILPIEVEIPFLRVLVEVKLDEAEWIQSRYDQLNLIEEKKVESYPSWADVPKANDTSLQQKGPYVVKKAFSGGALILTEMDGKSLPNPVNSDSHTRPILRIISPEDSAARLIKTTNLISLKLQWSSGAGHKSYLPEVAVEQTGNSESRFPEVVVE
ncbi:RNA-directed DNA polymerase (Reverse transcriptase), Ribonuclease H [Gossypium australe]|uniref:RNA-directed DNA polymerase (Reverse transcriptase), Ribonuclease H n=1 Tax=Gossypium australe TaxID=47621 RepID=A0A5B6WH70_9ROSI|nr:RNA-directed DNA polymerase (Reverse transcriptase), Ribonuclease H [Gossypium australe]